MNANWYEIVPLLFKEERVIITVLIVYIEPTFWLYFFKH